LQDDRRAVQDVQIEVRRSPADVGPAHPAWSRRQRTVYRIAVSGRSLGTRISVPASWNAQRHGRPGGLFDGAEHECEYCYRELAVMGCTVEQHCFALCARRGAAAARVRRSAYTLLELVLVLALLVVVASMIIPSAESM